MAGDLNHIVHFPFVLPLRLTSCIAPTSGKAEKLLAGVARVFGRMVIHLLRVKEALPLFALTDA